MNNDPYGSGDGGYPNGNNKRSANDIYRDAEIVGFICAFLATLVLGPIAADFTEPYMEEIFKQLYDEAFAGTLTTIWGFGMYALIWFVAKMFLVGMIITLIIGIYMRLPVVAAI